jgi:hypothetical protein
MVSHIYKCIFIHIPKSAGTSIKILLSQEESNVSYLVQDFKNISENLRFEPPPPHLRASDYLKYGFVDKSTFSEYYKFAFVRNPWDRIVSEYKFRRHSHRYDFKTFLFHHFPHPSWSDEYCHILPQYQFIFDSQENLLVDFVGKYENLKHDFNIVCKKLGISPTNLPHTNKSKSIIREFQNTPMEILKNFRDIFSIRYRKNNFRHYTEYYDNESEEFVRELYKKDIELFDYDFENNTSLSISQNNDIEEVVK